MRNSRKIAVKLAGATSVALLLATSAFADSRLQNGTWRNDDSNRRGDQLSGQSSNRGGYDNNSDRGSYRENDRVSLQGRVTSVNRENDGYRVRLDRNESSFWVPQSSLRNRARDLRVGVSISLGGIFRGGSVYVDAVSWPGEYGYAGGYGGSSYDQGYVHGVVDRVEYRRALVWLRDEVSGRIIPVDLRADRYGRFGISDLRRGDYIELSGQWTRNGAFEAYRIDTIRNRRY